VSFTLAWTDGHVENPAAVLTAPGTTTLRGDRGTVSTFVVGSNRRCSSLTRFR
jgi:hypothetical protein